MQRHDFNHFFQESPQQKETCEIYSKKKLMNFSFTQLATYSVIFRYFLRFLLNQNYIYVLLRSKP